MLDQSKTWAKLMMQRFGIVANDIEAATLCRPLGTERADDNMAPRPYRSRDLADICAALFGRGKEVKYSTVMPNVIRGWLQLNLGKISGEPMNAVRHVR